MRTSATHQATGFSLMEIVIALVVLGVMGVIGANFISDSVSTNQAISDEKLNYTSARNALDRMSREIREMKFDSTSGAMVATTMTATTLSFTKKGLTADTVVTLTNDSAQQTLSLAYNSGTSYVLANNISNSAGVFAYYQANAASAATSTADIRYVRINLTEKPANRQPRDLSNLIYLRNR